MAASPGPPGMVLPPVLRVAAWERVAGLRHGFFGRHGGVSEGDCASLNLSDRVGDRPGAIADNWTRVGRAVPGLDVARMEQVHGTRVSLVTSARQAVGEADGMLTAAAGVGLAVLTADCVPMLAYAPRRPAVMAVHAGWRGSLDGVAAAALRLAEQQLGIAPGEWQVALGPAIGGCCYQVEAEIGDRFVDRWGALPDAWQRAGGHGQLDLRRVNRAILTAAGVAPEAVTEVGPCTSCASPDFFSHRASRGRTGRQLSLIGLAEPPAGR